MRSLLSFAKATAAEVHELPAVTFSSRTGMPITGKLGRPYGEDEIWFHPHDITAVEFTRKCSEVWLIKDDNRPTTLDYLGNPLHKLSVVYVGVSGHIEKGVVKEIVSAGMVKVVYPSCPEGAIVEACKILKRDH